MGNFAENLNLGNRFRPPLLRASVSCKQRKFQQKIHSKWEIRMLNFEQKVSTDAEDSQVSILYGTVPIQHFCFVLFQ